ncbi:acyl-CoA thioester hydrolase [Geomicrobium halophilum]|uniref:Acyl-CoA thioester hydrolase n=1 Tax=Geomicrobium halophilum TaxID=549000 RepID=A0A841PZW5_9BACL|nr:thioesterase family protein [Geomicrobium halophilum]MBB6448418.1 acyl-CoA thioester hydrolase [Geomicrobium halophilum]
MTAKEVWHGEVRSEWVDYNGHMNDAAYAQVFSAALDALMEHIGLDETGRSGEDYTIFTLEAHLKYLAEAHVGQKLRVFVTLLDVDAKRMHLWFVMNNDQGDAIATSEQMAMGMDQHSGRPAPFPEKVNELVSKLPLLDQEHWPEAANQPMGIRRKK